MNLVQKVLVAAVTATAMASAAANAATVTCPGSPGGGDDISLNIGAVTSCSTSNGNGAFSPLAGYTLITADSFSPDVLNGSFSPGTGYSSLELFIQTGTGQPHPDQFVIVFSDVASFTWALLNSGSDKVSEADLYGLSTGTVTTTPLPAALPLFAGGLGLLGMISRRRKQKASAIATA